jgi:uncharacterized protein involved in outer membrane biogenesis
MTYFYGASTSGGTTANRIPTTVITDRVPAASGIRYTLSAKLCQSVAAHWSLAAQPGRVALNNFLVAVAVLLIAALSALFAVPRVVNWDGYRGFIEEEATRILGRDVRVGGKIKLRLLPTPTFTVQQIRIADTEANSGEPFFRADAIKGRLSIAPLLRGAVEADQIVLLRPLLHLVLDGEGGGNWSTLGQSGSRLGFVPADIALQAVRIEGGVLGIYGPDKSERLRLEAIDGEFSAQSLDGPFRFRGFFGTDPARRELRVSTTKQEADGSIRFKAALKQSDTGSSFTFDAQAVDLARSPRVEGELTAQIPLPQLTTVAPTGTQKSSSQKAEPEAPVELKAALSADLKAVKLTNLTLAFERQGRPQILTGEADISLAETVNVRAILAARWLDLDQLIGAGGETPSASSPASNPPGTAAPSNSSAQPNIQPGPISGLLTLATRLNGFNPEQGRVALSLSVEQANLGREAVSGLQLTLLGQGAETDIQELRIGLPGGARADIKGLMTGSGEETAFNGDLVLRGSSLARFLVWASAGEVVLDPARDGPFATRAKLLASPQAVQAREFVGELAGTVMQGELGYRWQGRREVSVLVEGPQVDLRALLPERAASAGAAPILSSLLAAAAQSAKTQGLDAILRVRAGQLLVPGATYQDATTDIELRDGRIRVNHLKLTANNGVSVEIEGDMPTLATQPRGTLRGVVAANDPAGLGVIADLIAWPPDSLPDPAKRGLLVPLRMAGAVTFGLGDTAPLDAIADGDAGGARLRIVARLDEGLKGWRRSPMDLSVTADGPTTHELVALLTTADNASRPGTKTTASATVQVLGRLADGLVTRAAFRSGTTHAAFNGRINAPGLVGTTAPLVWSEMNFLGDVTVAVPEDGRLPLGGWLSSLNAAQGSYSGTASIEASGRRIAMDQVVGTIGITRVTGQMTLTDTGGRTTINGRVNAGNTSIVAALGNVLETRPPSTVLTMASAALQPRASVWPITMFDAKALSNLDGEVAVMVDRLELPVPVGGNALSLTQANFTLAFGPGQIELRDLVAGAAGGRWTGALRLDRAGSTANMTAVLRAEAVDTAGLQAPATPVAQGTFGGLITLSGQGTSPHELISSLAGRGSFALSETRLKAPTAATVTNALALALAGPADQAPVTLRQQLTSAAPADLTVPQRSVPFELKNGTINVTPVTLATVEGRMQAQLALDLATLSVSGNWQIEVAALPPPPGWTATVSPTLTVPKPQTPLPAINVRFSAPLNALGDARATYSTEALEREVAVRKIERDLDELERLRKLDEDRTRVEAERRRLLENGGGQPASPLDPPRQPIAADGQTPAIPPIQPQPSELIQTTVPLAPEPAPRPRPAAAVPSPKPAYRPSTQDEQRRIFGGG